MSEEFGGGVDKAKRKERRLAGIFLGFVTGVSIAGGFGYTLAAAKKQEPNHFTKGFESGSQLALRALGRATLYSVGGFALFTFAVAKLLGVSSPDEFRQKMQSSLRATVPPVSTAKPPGRSDFTSIRELFEYLAGGDVPPKKSH